MEKEIQEAGVMEGNPIALIGCEESQAVCKAFRALGVEAYSNDLLPCSGGHPEWHLQMDVFEAIKKVKPQLLIAFPPCTYLTHAANRALKEQPQRKQLQIEAVKFFLNLYNCDIPLVALENPRGWITKYFRREDQVIQPFYFGHDERKRTCLWLKNLPPLIYTAINPDGIKPKKIIKRKTGNRAGGNYGYYYVQGKSAKDKSKTFPGIANAMAQQWAPLLKSNPQHP